MMGTQGHFLYRPSFGAKGLSEYASFDAGLVAADEELWKLVVDPPAAHKTSHQDGGSDQIDVSGIPLLGLTASKPIVTDADKKPASINYTGPTSFRASLGLEPTDTPEFSGITITTNFLQKNDSQNASIMRVYPQTGSDKNRILELYTNPDINNSPYILFGIAPTPGWVSSVPGAFLASSKTGTGTTQNLYLLAGDTVDTTLGITIKAGGHVGVGVIPLQKFHVNGTVLISENGLGTNYGQTQLYGGAGDHPALAIGGNQGTISDGIVRLDAYGSGYVAYIKQRGGGTFTLDLIQNGNIAISIDGAGKVGFGGDTAPAEMIDVAGNINVAGVIKIDDVQVVNNRVTGWTAATGTKSKTTFITDSVTLPNLAAAVGQIIDDLMSHGLQGA